MATLPKVANNDGVRRLDQTSFGGLDRRDATYDGKLVAMTNLSARSYPLLRPRDKRSIVKTVSGCNGVIDVGDELCSVIGGTVRHGDRVVGAVSDSPKTFAVLGDRVIILPDNVYVNMRPKGCYSTLLELMAAVRRPAVGVAYAVGTTSPADVYTWNGDEWVFVEKELGPLAASVAGAVTFAAEGVLYGVGAKRNAIRSADIEWSDYFNVGDAVAISGCVERPENDLTAVIRGIDGGDLYFDEDVFTLNSVWRYTVTAALRADYYHFVADGVSRYFAMTYAMSPGDTLSWDGDSLVAIVGGVRRVYRATIGQRGSCLTFIKSDGDVAEEEVTVARKVPAFTHLCAVNNRLWGCAGDTIYGSKLGDPFNFHVFEGLATDSYTVDSGTAGNFTACCGYLGYPTFFKEDRIVKIYGSRPADFSLVTTAAVGVKAGSGQSLAIAGDALFYHSPKGFMAYGGGFPVACAASLTDLAQRDAVAGSDGFNYYVSVQDDAGNDHFLVYDVVHGLWHREDDTAAMGFFRRDGHLCCVTDDGWLSVDGPDSAGLDVETAVCWEACFDDYFAATPEKKTVLRVIPRLELADDAEVDVYFQGDGEGEVRIGATLRGGGLRSAVLPVAPRRVDHFRLRLVGKGDCKLYGLAVEYTLASL